MWALWQPHVLFVSCEGGTVGTRVYSCYHSCLRLLWSPGTHSRQPLSFSHNACLQDLKSEANGRLKAPLVVQEGKSQTDSWTRFKPNKQTLLVLLLHKKHFNPELPRAEERQRRICWLSLYYTEVRSLMCSRRNAGLEGSSYFAKLNFLLLQLKKKEKKSHP